MYNVTRLILNTLNVLDFVINLNEATVEHSDSVFLWSV